MRMPHARRAVPSNVRIYVALLNEGIAVWRPVQAYPLGSNLFRIIGADDDASDETWEFPLGSIVTCTPRRFQNGQVELVAEERLSVA